MIPKIDHLACEKCGVVLIDSRGQRRSIGIKWVNNEPHYYCYECHEMLGKKIFEKEIEHE